MRQKGFAPIIILILILPLILVGYLAFGKGFKNLPFYRFGSSPTSEPTTPTPDEVILSATLNEDCKISVKSSVKEYEISSGWGDMGTSFKCTPEPVGKISPSGKYLAFGDVSGGVDSVMALFSLDYEKKVILGIWGTSVISDYIFLPDDRMVSLNGYPTTYDEMTLTLFDLPVIFTDFDKNFDKEYWYLDPVIPTVEAKLTLPNKGKYYEKLDYKDGQIQILTKDNEVIDQYYPGSIVGSQWGI